MGPHAPAAIEMFSGRGQPSCEQLIDLIGPTATLMRDAEGALGDGVLEFAHRQAQLSATPGGTVEVFRTMIAQGDLGLPRPDYPGRRAFLASERPGA